MVVWHLTMKVFTPNAMREKHCKKYDITRGFNRSWLLAAYHCLCCQKFALYHWLLRFDFHSNHHKWQGWLPLSLTNPDAYFETCWKSCVAVNTSVLPAKCWLLLHVIRACSWRWPNVFTLSWETFSLVGNKIHCSPWDKSLSVKILHHEQKTGLSK